MLNQILDEKSLEQKIEEFQRLFGIVDEGAIVSDDDYEKSISISYEEMNRGRA